MTRLVTFVDIDDTVASARRMSVSARHEAALTDGRHVLLLNDRGWSSFGPPDIWALTSVADIVATARVVVGPDEPVDGHSQEDMEAGHWAHLAETLRQHGVTVDARLLQQQPHDVVLSLDPPCGLVVR